MMSCKHWKDEWVAHLYDELDPAEQSRLVEHLDACRDCRRTLERLDASRRLLRDSAPAVPAAPRVVVLPRPRLRRPVWAFAAGMACAVLLFGAGLLAGMLRAPAATPASGLPAAELGAAAAENLSPTRADLDEVWRAQQSLERRLARFEGGLSDQTGGEAIPALLTRPQLEQAVASLQRQFEIEQARHTQFLLEELNATEMRAGRWVDDTWKALQLVQLQSDPRFSER